KSLAVVNAPETVLAALDGRRAHLLDLRGHEADMLGRLARLAFVVERPKAHFALDIAEALLVLLGVVVGEADHGAKDARTRGGEKAAGKVSRARDQPTTTALAVVVGPEPVLIIPVDNPRHVRGRDRRHVRVD